MTLKNWSWIVVLSVIWGGSFFCNKVAVQSLPTFTIVAGRVMLAAAALLAVVFISGQAMPKKLSVWRSYFIMGLLNNAAPFSLIVWGQTHISSGLAAILNATTPLFTAVLAHFLTQDERLTPSRLLGIVLGITGVTVMIGPSLLSGLTGNVAASGAVLAAACSYAYAGIYGRRLGGYSPLVNATGQLCASASLMIPLALWLDHPWLLAAPSPAALSAVLALALLCTACAYILYFRLLVLVGPSNLMLVTLLIPFSALLLGTMLLGESLSPDQLTGMALISLALVIIDGRVTLWLPRLAPAHKNNGRRTRP